MIIVRKPGSGSRGYWVNYKSWYLHRRRVAEGLPVELPAKSSEVLLLDGHEVSPYDRGLSAFFNDIAMGLQDGLEWHGKERKNGQTRRTGVSAHQS